MVFRKINSNFGDFKAFRELYYSSFPKNERTPYMVLKKAILNYKNFEAIAVYDENLFKGFCVLANHKNISHILFIAINKKFRGNNLGSKLLKYVCETKKDKVILADLEVPNDHCFDNSRERRIKFYVKNGFKKSRINYIWNNDEFYIYEKNGEVSEKSFWDFFLICKKLTTCQMNLFNVFIFLYICYPFSHTIDCINQHCDRSY